MSLPTITVRIAFASDPFDAVPTWSDVSSDVLEIYTRRGRQHELDRMEAGEATIVLDNSSGVYWPYKTGGYYPNVLPGKRVNIQTTYGGIIYDLYTGFVEAWQPNWLTIVGKVPIVTVRCVDLIKNLARLLLNDGTGYAEEKSGVRFGNVLDDLGWPDNAWTSPTNFEDPDTAWTDETNAYDDDTESLAYTTLAWPGPDWCSFIELTVAAMLCNAIRFNAYYLAAKINEIDIDIYDGSWHHVYEGSYADATWTTKTFADRIITKVRVRFYNAGTTDAAILYELDFGLLCRDLGIGQSDMQATGALENVNAQSHSSKVQQSELGILFIAPDGTVIFQDRHARLKAPYTTSQATFGDDPGEQYYRDIEPSYDDQFIYNDIRITRQGGTEQTASDATSQTTYGQRSLSRTGLLMTLDTDASDHAEYLLSRFKDAVLRSKTLVINPERDSANLYPKILSYDISTRITVRLNQASIDHDYHIEGINHDYIARRGIWKTRWQLSDAGSEIYWVLGVAGFSELSLTTKLAY